MDRVNTFVKNLRKRIAVSNFEQSVRNNIILIIMDEFQVMLDEEMAALALAHGVDDSIAEMKEGI